MSRITLFCCNFFASITLAMVLFDKYHIWLLMIMLMIVSGRKTIAQCDDHQNGEEFLQNCSYWWAIADSYARCISMMIMILLG